MTNQSIVAYTMVTVVIMLANGFTLLYTSGFNFWRI